MNEELQQVKQAWKECPLINYQGKKFVINPLTEQIPYTSANLLKSACKLLADRIDLEKTTKLLTEEDKGAILIAGVSWITGLPIAMARWYPTGIASQVKQSFKMEYAQGNLYVNGIQPGDKVAIIEDVISTGGTLIALIKAVQQANAQVVKAVSLVEKVNYPGVQNVFNQTGVKVETLIKIDVSGQQCKVIE